VGDVAGTPDTAATAGAVSASGAASVTAADADGGATGTGSVVGACLTPAHPAARKQESVSTMLADRGIAAQSNIGLSGSATTDEALH
jgi:hypothetical protein